MKRYIPAILLLFLIVSNNTIADSTFDLTEFKGKVVMLDF